MTEPEPLRSLERILRQSIGSLAPHCNLLARLILAILAERTISMTWISAVLNTAALPESNRTRIRRFFDDFRVSPEAFAKIIAAFLPNASWILALDRTNWFFGKTPCNLLVLAVVFKGCAVPLLWASLDHQGNSDTDLRISLLSQFLQLFGAEKIKYLTGDREFTGEEWFKWLVKNEVSFRVRIKKNNRVLTPKKQSKEVSSLFGRTNRCKAGRFLLFGVPVYLGGKPLGNGEWLIVASSERGDLLTDYRRRWEIECLFQALKGRGFDLECIRITQEHRLCALLGVLAVVYLVCVRAGQVVAEETCKSTGRLRKSLFKRGLERMHRVALAFVDPPSKREWKYFYQAFMPLKT
jgi:hypothetical protein